MAKANTAENPAGRNNNVRLHTLSVYVANKPGVLARVALLFARRGYNIESLVVSPAMDGEFSRMTIGARGDSECLDQIIKHVSKLVDIISCVEHGGEDAVVKELVMVKILADSSARTEVLQISEHFGCRTADLTETSLILQATGSTERLDALITMLRKFPIVELVRTGKVLMARGQEVT